MQTWHHVLEKSEPQINNINALHGPFRRLLFNSGLTVYMKTPRRAQPPSSALKSGPRVRLTPSMSSALASFQKSKYLRASKTLLLNSALASRGDRPLRKANSARAE